MEGAKAYVLLIMAILIGALFILGSTRLVGAAQHAAAAGGGSGQTPTTLAPAPINLPAALPGVFVVGHELFLKVSPALSRVLFDGRPIAVREISPSDLLSTPNRSAILIDVDQLPVNSSLQILGALIKRGDLVALYGGNYSEGYLAYALGIAWASAYGEKFLAVPVAAIGDKLVGAYGDGHGIIYAPTSIEDLPTMLEKYTEWLTASSAKAGLALSPATESLQSTSTGGDPCLYMPNTTNVYTLTEYTAYSDGNGYFGYDMCIYIDTNAISVNAYSPFIPITIGGYVYYTPSSTLVNNLGRIMYLNGTLDGAASYEYMQSGLTNSAVDVMGTFLSPGPTSNQPQYSVIIGYPPTSLITITISTPSTVTIDTYDYASLIAGDNYTWQYIFSSTQANQIYTGAFADSYAGWNLHGGGPIYTAVLPEDLAVKLVTSQTLPVCDSYVSADYELIWVVNYWYLYYNPSGNWSAKAIIQSQLASNPYITGVSSWSEEIPVVC